MSNSRITPTASPTIAAFLDHVSGWAAQQANILVVILVGSQAGGEAKSDSDVDLIIICNETGRYLRQVEWIRNFGKPSRVVFEDWGMVTSVRVWYKDWLEVEFGITNEEWGKEPLVAGTKTRN